MILITEFMDAAAVDDLNDSIGAEYQPDLADRPQDIPALLAGKRALIVRNRTQVTADLLAIAPSLECVGRLGVGLDNIDLDACKAAGVAVYPATGANNHSVAEYVITTAMMLLRGAYQRHDQMIDGQWPRSAASGREISGKTLGLLGVGSIARDTAAIGRSLNMRIIGHDPFQPADSGAWNGIENVQAGDLFQQADIVSLHVPLTEGTKHMIGADELAMMRPGAVLINAARGGVVDEVALVAALKGGKIGGAALDVFEVEPLDHEGGKRFRNVPNLILTPHIAGVTEESNTRVSRMIAERVATHLAGRERTAQSEQ